MHGVAFGYASTYLLDATVPLSALPGRAHQRSADSGYYYYYYYYYKSKDFSDASQKVAGALYKVTVCAVQVALTVKKSAKAVSHWNDS